MAFNDQYEFLGKSAGAMGTASRLYLGDDHLLVIDISGYTERYRRFQYSKIQAINIQSTKESNMLTGLILFMLLLVSGISTLFDTSSRQMIFLACTALPLALGLVIHLRSGKSCVTYMHTAVSSVKLGALNRLGKTQQAVARLDAKISEAQAELAQQQAAKVESTQADATHEPAETPVETPVEQILSTDETATAEALAEPSDGES